MGRDCKKEKRGKNWDETNIKPKEWGETVKERTEEKKTGARQILSQKNEGRRGAKETGARQKVTAKRMERD